MPCPWLLQRKCVCGFPESGPVDKAFSTTMGSWGYGRVVLESHSAVEWWLLQVLLDAVLPFPKLVWEEESPLWWVDQYPCTAELGDSAEEAQGESLWAWHPWARYRGWRIWEGGETREMAVRLALNQLPFKAEWNHMKQNLKKPNKKHVKCIHAPFVCMWSSGWKLGLMCKWTC